MLSTNIDFGYSYQKKTGIKDRWTMIYLINNGLWSFGSSYNNMFLVFTWSNDVHIVEGDRGREPGWIGAGSGREAGADGAGCRSHVRAGGGRRMRDIKFCWLFSPFLSKLSKIRTKEHWLFTILTVIKLYRQSWE